MAVRVCKGPKLYEVKYGKNVSKEFSFNAIFEYMRENKVCENLDREIQELKRQEASSWARARERGARF